MEKVKRVLPIKDTKLLKAVEANLLHGFRAGRRNYTIFQVGKVTLLPVTLVLHLKISDIYDDNGNVKNDVIIYDPKTGKFNKLYLQPLIADLKKYYQWLNAKRLLAGQWLFPSINNIMLPITEHQYYRIMHQVGQSLGIDYLGTHTMRKTGAYRIYMQTNHNIELVTKLLNYTNEAITRNYLDLADESIAERLNKIDFG